MNSQKMLRVISRRTFVLIFQVMTVVVNYRKKEKQVKKIPLHLKSTLAKPPTYDRTYPETLSTASPVSFTERSSLLLFCNRKKTLKGRQRPRKPLLTFPAKNPRQMCARSQNLHQNSPLSVYIASTVFQFK